MKCPNVRVCVTQQVMRYSTPFVRSSKCSLNYLLATRESGDMANTCKSQRVYILRADYLVMCSVITITSSGGQKHI